MEKSTELVLLHRNVKQFQYALCHFLKIWTCFIDPRFFSELGLRIFPGRSRIFCYFYDRKPKRGFGDTALPSTYGQTSVTDG